jgi:hypothetical protein
LAAGDSATHVFAVGNDRPLDQPTQHPTTEMIRWLNELDVEGSEGHLLARSVPRLIRLAADAPDEVTTRRPARPSIDPGHRTLLNWSVPRTRRARSNGMPSGLPKAHLQRTSPCKDEAGHAKHQFHAAYGNVGAAEDACRLFRAEPPYVKPHGGADATLVAFWSVISARVEVPAPAELGAQHPAAMSVEQWNEVRRRCGNQPTTGLDCYSGGYLTRGCRHNVSAQIFEAYTCTVAPSTGRLDYDAIEAQARAVKPLILLAGYGA